MNTNLPNIRNNVTLSPQQSGMYVQEMGNNTTYELLRRRIKKERRSLRADIKELRKRLIRNSNSMTDNIMFAYLTGELNALNTVLDLLEEEEEMEMETYETYGGRSLSQKDTSSIYDV